MLANARNLDYLNMLKRPKDVRNAVKMWRKNVDATFAELWRAMMWAKYGDEDVEADMKKCIKDSIENEHYMEMVWYNLIAAAGAVGVSPNDLKTQTHSELVATLVQANLHARIPMKQSIAEDYIAYRQLIKRIEERGVSNG